MIKALRSLLLLMAQNSKNFKCLFCKNEHNSCDCPQAAKMPLAEKKKVLSHKGLCHACLKFGHIYKFCRTSVKCQKCHRRHVTVMCPKEDKSDILPSSSISTSENLSNLTYNHVVLQTLAVRLLGKKSSRIVRVLFDTGSQRSYINKNIVMELGYDSIRQEEMIHALFGGYKTEVVKHNCFKIYLRSLAGDYCCNFDVLDQPVICSNTYSVNENLWKQETDELGIQLHDIHQGPVDILIGADVAGRLFTGQKKVLKSGLVLMQTKLGWTIMGKTVSNCSSLSMTVFSVLQKFTCC